MCANVHVTGFPEELLYLGPFDKVTFLYDVAPAYHRCNVYG